MPNKMTNFCPSCGIKLEAEPSSKPMPSAGKGIFGLNIKKEDLVGQWEGKIDVDYAGVKGFLLMTKNELIFVRRGESKGYWRIPLSTVTSVQRVPLLNYLYIRFKPPKGAGFVKKFMEKHERVFKIKDSKSFIEKLKELNPKIK